MFSRRRSNKKEEVTVSRKYSQITFRVDKVSQTRASLLDTIATSSNGSRLGERMLSEQMAVVQTTAQMLQEFCRKAASGFGVGSTGRQE